MNQFQRIACRLLRIKPPEKAVIQTRESWKVRLHEWQQAPQMVAEAAILARNPTYRGQLDVLRVEHPCHSIFAKTGVAANDRLIHQGQIEGYELCLNNLEAFTKPFKKKTGLTATFADPAEDRKK